MRNYQPIGIPSLIPHNLFIKITIFSTFLSQNVGVHVRPFKWHMLRSFNVTFKLSDGGLNIETLEIVLFPLPVME